MDKLEPECIEYLLSIGYTFQKVIGKGAFGKVVLVVNEANENFAIKVINCGDRENEGINSYEKEKEITEKFGHHPNLPKYYSFSKHGIFAYIVMEYFEYKSIDGYIPKSEQEFVTIAYQLISTVNYLHQSNIIHRDIKPLNILFNEVECKVIVIDFGCSKYMDNKESFGSYGNIGTEFYNAPEMEKNKMATKTKKVDVYSIGRTLEEIALSIVKKLRLMEYGRANTKIGGMPRMFKSFLRLRNDLSGISFQFANLIQKCLIEDPTLRCDTLKLLQHEIFKDLYDPSKLVVPIAIDIPSTRILKYDINEPLTSGADIIESEEIRTIEFGPLFDNCLDGIPSNVRIIKFNTKSIYNQDMNDWGDCIEHLSFGISYSKMEWKKLPQYLVSLEYYGESTKLKHIPTTIVYLSISGFNGIIEKNCLSNGLQFLQLGYNQTIKTIQSFVNIPVSVAELSFGCSIDTFGEITYDMLPCGFKYQGKTYLSALTKLVIHTSGMDHIIDVSKASQGGKLVVLYSIETIIIKLDQLDLSSSQ